MTTGAGSQADARAAVGGRFPCFDGLRAIAAVSVLLTHVAFAAGANSGSVFGRFFARMDAGVAVFFVISGFLLYRPFVSAHFAERAAPATGPYFWRRFLRIYPAYWLVVVVVVYVFADKHIHDFESFVLWFGLVHIYSEKHSFGPLVQSWTLATEVSFYVFLPIWAWLIRRRTARATSGRLRRELVGIALLVAVSVAWKAFVLSYGFTDGRIGQLKMWLPWWLDMFAVGMLLAVVSVTTAEHRLAVPLRLDARHAPAICWAVALGAFCLVSTGIGMPYKTGAIPLHLLWGQHYLYLATAVFLVLPAVFGPQTRDSSGVRRFLMSPVIVFLGVVSYGIYLWHDPWIDRYLSWTGSQLFTIYHGDVPFSWHTGSVLSVPFFTMTLAILALTVATAALSWYALERPALALKRFGDRSMGRRPRPGLAAGRAPQRGEGAATPNGEGPTEAGRPGVAVPPEAPHR
jgi:peptidoglycan/LPS O-acetylase OafA/YrhL